MTNNRSWLDRLDSLDPCWEGFAWAKKQKDIHAAWAHCKRGDWMLWLVGRLSGPPDSQSRRCIVRTALACAQLAPLCSDAEVERARQKCLSKISDYIRDQALLHEVKVISNTTADVIDPSEDDSVQAAFYVAVAAYVSDANDVADCAANAAYSASQAVDGITVLPSKILARCADIVRQYYPRAPRLP